MPLDAVESAIREALGDASSRFVFPSSIAAEHWLKEAARMAAGRAVARERFLSWDSFKEATTSAGLPGKRPAGRELRLVFCADLLSRNAKKPFLASVVAPEHRESWKQFAPVLASSLPALARLEGAGGRGAPDAEGALADYRAIRDAYSSFLDSRGFFEPSWESRRFDPNGSRWTVFFPELIEDFGEFDEVLAARPEVRVQRDVSVLQDGAVPDAGGTNAALVVHESVLDEIRWALEGIGRAIDSGLAEPGDIAVTVPGFSSLKPYIQREAALFGVPVDFRSGESLADYPAGRFFSLLARSAESGFGFAELRDLVLSGGIPWREKAAASRLVEFGLKYTVLCPWSDGRRRIDPWLASFRSCGGGRWDDAEAFYRGLSAQAGEFAKARDFKSLKAAWLAMRHSLLDPAGFPEDLDRVFARCVACLDDLAAAQEDAGLDELPGALFLFLQDLSAQRYVPRSAPGGVRFYDYRVSAGIRPRIHYVLNASQGAVDVRTGGCSFLREDLRATLSLEQRDASGDFIRRYAESGDEVYFSCSMKGLDGAQVPHGHFPGGSARKGSAGAAVRGPSGAERSYWAVEAGFPERLPGILLNGLEAAARSSFARQGGDFRSDPDPAWGSRASGKLESLNVTMIDAYRSCPFAWFFGKSLGARETRSGISSFDAAFRGIAVHRAFQLLYEEIRRKGEVKKALLDEYRSMVPRVLDAAIRDCERERGPFAGIVLEAGREGIEATMASAVEIDCDFFDGCSVFGVEMEIECRDGAAGRAVAGRIDRLMEAGDDLWIVDYKTGKITMKDYAPDGEDGSTVDLQMPAYARLVASKGRAVKGILLYGVKERAYKVVAADERPPFMGPKTAVPMTLAQLGTAGERFAETARAVAEGIGAGVFRTAEPADRGKVCQDCRLRPVCREHYQVR